MTNDGRTFANSFENSRFNELWQFRVAAAVKMLFAAAIFALTAVVLYRFAASGGILEPFLFQAEPPQSVPPEFEPMPESGKNGVLFIQAIWALIMGLMRAGIHLLLLAGVVACVLAAGVSVMFAAFELELAYSPPTETGEGGSDEPDEPIQSDTTAQDLLGEVR